jgi:hypothetical protein
MGLIDSTVPIADALALVPDSAVKIAVGMVSVPVVCFMTDLRKA